MIKKLIENHDLKVKIAEAAFSRGRSDARKELLPESEKLAKRVKHLSGIADSLENDYRLKRIALENALEDEKRQALKEQQIHYEGLMEEQSEAHASELKLLRGEVEVIRQRNDRLRKKRLHALTRAHNYLRMIRELLHRIEHKAVQVARHDEEVESKLQESIRSLEKKKVRMQDFHSFEEELRNLERNFRVGELPEFSEKVEVDVLLPPLAQEEAQKKH